MTKVPEVQVHLVDRPWPGVTIFRNECAWFQVLDPGNWRFEIKTQPLHFGLAWQWNTNPALRSGAMIPGKCLCKWWKKLREGGRKEAKGTFTASCAVFTVIRVEDPECQQEDFLEGKLGSVG
jgi:hypothetical protein